MTFILSVFWEFLRWLRQAGLRPVESAQQVDMTPPPAPAAVLKVRLKVDEANKWMRPEAIEGMRRRLAGEPTAPREPTIDRSGWEDGDSDDRAGVTWEPAEIEFLLNLFEAGFSCDKLAVLHRRTEGAIAAQLERHRMLYREGLQYLTKNGVIWWTRPRKYA